MASDARALYSAHPGTLTAGGTKTLGLAWIVYGVVRLVVTVWLIAFTTNATLMFGALLTRVPDPFSLMTWFHILYSAVIVWSGISAVLGIVAGLALLATQRAPRVLIVAAALLALPELPFGIMLGVYTMTHIAPRD
ncbi:MAG TPA: hypothetical protein VH022_13425 [Candidatus Acidoferrum sp.]|jgi:hypothetical protein|nr:hypothetical protein [Candidatus Acidoferrum sp.]